MAKSDVSEVSGKPASFQSAYADRLPLWVILGALLGVLIVLCDRALGGKILGALILLTGPGALFLMTTPWTRALGLAGTQVGLQQRAALFCLWLALVLFLALATCRAAQQEATRARPFWFES